VIEIRFAVASAGIQEGGIMRVRHQGMFRTDVTVWSLLIHPLKLVEWFKI
jgi:hypothetical protein